MSVVEGGAKPAGLVARVTNILTRPGSEWDVIAGEPATTASLFTGYACILALIPLIGTLISRVILHSLLGGFLGGGFGMMAGLIGGVVLGVVGYALTLGMVFVVSLIINALAPTFDAQPDAVQALKVSVYSGTAMWVVGIVSWIPVLGWLLGLAALGYTCYLLYLGVAKLMKPPAEKAVGYAVVVILLEIVVYAVVGWIMVIVGAMAVFGAAATGAAAFSSNANHAAALGNLAAASRQIQAAAEQAQSNAQTGKVVAIDPDKLKMLLPDNIAGAPRTDVEATSASAAGFGGSNAKATYDKNDAHITLMITDLAAAGGFAAMAGAMNVQENKETATGYEKAGNVNGRWTMERYDNQAKSGSYSVLIANRFNLEAEGSGVSIDDLKSAVAAVGPDRLQALANG
ncbi:MAG: YIP1 family protein [Caulobacteraceae bacterium]|nr:YIP1 family protein [Caulobacteraceae bacterium]